ERDAAIVEHLRLTKSESEARAANLAKDQFIAMLSHELRTPLTPVLAAASAFAESEDLPAELRSAFAIVQRNVMTEVQLIDDLLDVARITRGRLRVDKRHVDAHRAVGDALETLTADMAEKNLALIVELKAERAWVNGDLTRLEQVIWNLLRNAVKFTPEGGQITVRTWNHQHRLRIEVSDTGRGIDSERLARLFEPFQRVTDESPESSSGLGLGLSICRGILEQHGATITADSQGAGKGSRFVVELDTIESPTPQEEVRQSSAPPPPGPRVRILLVEDHEDTAEVLQWLLQRSGYEVQVVHSVRAALAVDRAQFDVLLSDIGLADGTGLELMRALRKKGKVKGVALSGFGTDEDVRASKEAGFSAHVTKPVQFHSLVEAIASLHTH
ncbi:MAG TPA: ATP-binding protein, partial [Polyangiaceae bacterium]|nr:ATP-binding protein [Polyangiaceae bacterium]